MGNKTRAGSRPVASVFLINKATITHAVHFPPHHLCENTTLTSDFLESGHKLKLSNWIQSVSCSLTALRCYMPWRGWPDSQHPIDRGLMSLSGPQRSGLVGPLLHIWTKL